MFKLDMPALIGPPWSGSWAAGGGGLKWEKGREGGTLVSM